MLGEYHLRQQVGSNPELMEKLTPNYTFGCKRITPSNEYFPALANPHVEVITSKIKEVKSNSIETEDGKEQKIDV
jgi:cation diffusion facilitator CzcD-associated flavoprotein CzcO